METPTIYGDVLTITKEDTADKARDNYKTVNNQRIKMTDEEFTVKMNIESHIDEVAAGVKPDTAMEDDVVSLIKSVYPLDDFKTRIMRIAENGKLIVTDKEKAQTILTTVGVQPSEVSRLFELSKDSLSQKGINVKKNSIETDSKGRKLTREQSEALSDIRKQFFEVLDGAGVNYREGGAVESETKLSKSSNKSLTSSKGKGYNNNNRIKLSEREYAMVSSAVMAYNTRFGKENELKPIIGVNANNTIGNNKSFSDNNAEFILK